MTRKKVGGTGHKWLVEDAQALIGELSSQYRAAAENLRREQRQQATLDLVQAGLTLVSLQRLIGEMQLLIASDRTYTAGGDE
jgi:hypothetical protein